MRPQYFALAAVPSTGSGQAPAAFLQRVNFIAEDGDESER